MSEQGKHRTAEQLEVGGVMPLRADDNYRVPLSTLAGETVAVAYALDMAELIVQAVNCHGELVAALRGLYTLCPPGHKEDEAGLWYAARAAIAKAEG